MGSAGGHDKGCPWARTGWEPLDKDIRGWNEAPQPCPRLPEPLTLCLGAVLGDSSLRTGWRTSRTTAFPGTRLSKTKTQLTPETLAFWGEKLVANSGLRLPILLFVARTWPPRLLDY